MSDLSDLVLARRLPDLATRKGLRVAAGITQAELSEYIGVSATAVHLWETGKAEPSGIRRLKYVKALDDLKEIVKKW